MTRTLNLKTAELSKRLKAAAPRKHLKRQREDDPVDLERPAKRARSPPSSTPAEVLPLLPSPLSLILAQAQVVAELIDVASPSTSAQVLLLPSVTTLIVGEDRVEL